MRKGSEDLGRYSDPSLLILLSLAGGPKHGYGMMEDILEFSGTRLEPGTLYGAISRLDSRGWIETMESGDRRRPYRITNTGRDALKQQMATLRKLVTLDAQRTT